MLNTPAASRRLWFRRTRSLFESLCDLAARRRPAPARRPALGVLALEDRTVPSAFQVNTTTTDQQTAPSVAAQPDGSSVVVWASYGQHGDNWDVVGQRYGLSGNPVSGYNSDGTPTDGEFRVNTTFWGVQDAPVVAALPDGGFVVVWEAWNAPNTVAADVFAQRYDADGHPVGGYNPDGTATAGEFRVNTYTVGDQSAPSIAALAGGGFAVVWNSGGQRGDGTWDIYAQAYGADGRPVGGEAVVNTHGADVQWYPDVAGLADGGFVVAWDSAWEDGRFGYDVYGRRFGASGAARDALEFPLNAQDRWYDNEYINEIAGTPDGGFVAVWQTGLDGLDVMARKFDAAAQGPAEQRVNTYTAGDQTNAVVAAAGDGSYLVAWQSAGQDGAASSIHAQRFNADGTPDGGEFQIGGGNGYNQSSPQLSGYGAGKFDAVWVDDGADGSGTGIGGQQDIGSLQDNETTILDHADTEYLRVRSSVTPEGDNYRWQYQVTNLNFTDLGYGGAGSFEIVGLDTTGITDVTTSGGWSYFVDDGSVTGTPKVRWGGGGDFGGVLQPGQTLTFSFLTPARPIGQSVAQAWGPDVAYDADGQVLAPQKNKSGVSALLFEENIPVNANNDNNSGWAQNRIPKKRDFDSNKVLTDPDPQLVRMDISWTMNGTALKLEGKSTGTGRLKFWTTAKKDAPADTVTVQGNNGRVTVYVEGVKESKAVGDILLQVSLMNNGVVQDTWSKKVTVTPVIKSFKVIPAPGQNINFPYERQPDGTLQATGLSGLSANSVKANTPWVSDQPGATFQAEVVDDGIVMTGPNGNATMDFVQNVVGIDNGFNAHGSGWVYLPGSNIADKNLLPRTDTLPPLVRPTIPMVDSTSSDAPGTYFPFYHLGWSLNSGADGTSIYKATDSPTTFYPDNPVGSGTPDNAANKQTAMIDVLYRYKLYLVATYLDRSIYPVASIEWQVNFWADTNDPTKGVTNIRVKDGVTAKEFVAGNAVPLTEGWTANSGIVWRTGS